MSERLTEQEPREVRAARRRMEELRDSAVENRCLGCGHVKHNELGYCQVGQCGCESGATVGAQGVLLLRDLPELLVSSEARGAQAVRERVEAVLADLESVVENRRRINSDDGAAFMVATSVTAVRAALSDPGTSSEGGQMCALCGKPIRRRGTAWEHYSSTWQGIRCPGSLNTARPIPARTDENEATR